MKRGPKKGWLAALREKLTRTEYQRDSYLIAIRRMDKQQEMLVRRIDYFNNMPFWSKVLFLLKGGHV